MGLAVVIFGGLIVLVLTLWAALVGLDRLPPNDRWRLVGTAVIAILGLIVALLASWD